jgi:hypothetical protein
MRDIDPLRDFINPEMTMVRKILCNDIYVVAGITTIRGQTYASPLIWNDADAAYEVLAISVLLQPGIGAAGLNLWSKVGVELRQPHRDEILHLLIPGVANLPHSPRQLHK